LTYGSAAFAGSVAFKRLHHIMSIHMDQRGLSVAKLLNNVEEALAAELPVVIRRGKDANGGILEDVKMVPDSKTRLKATEMALRLQGELQRQADVIVVTPPPPAANNTNVLNVTLKPQMLKDFEDSVMAQIKQQYIDKSNSEVEEGQVV